MIVRLAYFSALVFLGVVALFTHLDRASNLSDSLAASIPSAFSANAAGIRATDAIIAQDPYIALAEAQLQLQLRPLPAESLMTLAMAANLSGDDALAIAALEEAARRGWREPLSQLAAGEGALATGDYDAAAQRVAALLSTGAMRELTLDLFRRLAASEDGRQALARRYAAAGHWQENSINAAQAVVPAGDMALLMRDALAYGASLPCNRLDRLAQSYRNSGEGEAAALFWPGDCRVN